MSICEYCGKEHDGSFATGRFCSRSCSNGFSTKSKRKEINEKISKKLKGDSRCAWNKGRRKLRTCPVCSKKYTTITTTCSKECKSKKMSEAQIKAYISGNNFIAGGTTKWHQYKNIKVQGSYELRVCYILDKWKDIGIIESWEYTKDRVSYTDVNGKQRSYLLDFKVHNLDGTWYYLETKGYKRENDDLKWKSVREKGYILFIWFDEHISNNENFGLWNC